jgi:hypothetical protein
MVKQPHPPDDQDRQIDELENDPDVSKVLGVLKEIVVNDGIDLRDLPDRTAKRKKSKNRKRRGPGSSSPS